VHNTLFLDDELLFRRPSLSAVGDDELADIEFADMEPVDATDVVGVPPYQVTASIPFPQLDLVGVPPSVAVAVAVREPMSLRGLRPPSRVGPEELPTEEFVDDRYTA
jgi:hypothetical protein